MCSGDECSDEGMLFGVRGILVLIMISQGLAQPAIEYFKGFSEVLKRLFKKRAMLCQIVFK